MNFLTITSHRLHILIWLLWMLNCTFSHVTVWQESLEKKSSKVNIHFKNLTWRAGSPAWGLSLLVNNMMRLCPIFWELTSKKNINYLTFNTLTDWVIVTARCASRHIRLQHSVSTVPYPWLLLSQCSSHPTMPVVSPPLLFSN